MFDLVSQAAAYWRGRLHPIWQHVLKLPPTQHPETGLSAYVLALYCLVGLASSLAILILEFFLPDIGAFEMLITLCGAGALLAVYLLNRRGHFALARLILLITMQLVTWAILLFTHSVLRYIVLLFPILATSLLWRPPVTVLAFVLNYGFAALLVHYLPMASHDLNWLFLAYLPININVSIMVYAWRRANMRLTEHNKALEASELRFRTLTENALDVVMLVRTRDNVATYANRAHLLGHEMATVNTFERYLQLVHPEDRERLRRYAMWRNAHSDPPQSEIEYRLQDSDGQYQWLQSRTSVMESAPDGRPEYLLTQLTCITERKQLEERLTRSLRYESVLSSCSRALLRNRDMDSALPFVLEHLLTAVGVSRGYIFQRSEHPVWGPALFLRYEAALLGVRRKAILESNQPLILNAFSAELAHSMAHPDGYSGLISQLNGRDQRLLANLEIVSTAGLPLFVGGEWWGFTGFDHATEPYMWTEDDMRMLRTATEMISVYIEQQLTEQALRQSEERNRAMLEAMPDIVIIYDGQGRAVDYHVQHMSDLNIPPEEFLGRTPQQFTTPDVAAEIVGALQQVRESGAGVSTENSYIYDDRTLYYEVRYEPLGNGHIMALTRNITEQREAERNRVQLLLEQEKIRILSEFITNATHQFLSPLAVINTNIYMLARQPDPVKQAEYRQRVMDQTELIRQLVDALNIMMTLDTRMPSMIERCNLNALLWHYAAHYETAIAERKLTLRYDLTPDTVFIQGDEGYLFRAFEHLVDNALRYTLPGGTLTIRSRVRGGWVRVEIRDTGVGIPLVEQERIFERFYRIDKAGTTPGFGLGLPIARKIIEVHGGCLRLYSQPDVGTRLVAYLPQVL